MTEAKHLVAKGGAPSMAARQWRDGSPLRNLPNHPTGFLAPFPDHFAGDRVEGVKVSHGSEGKSKTVVNRDRGAGSDIVGDVFVDTRLGKFPKCFAGVPIQTENPFLLDFGIEPSIHQVDSVFCHSGAAVTGTHRHRPGAFQAAVRKRLDQSGLAPDAVPLFPAPLRPCLGFEMPGRSQKQEKTGGDWKKRGRHAAVSFLTSCGAMQVIASTLASIAYLERDLCVSRRAHLICSPVSRQHFRRARIQSTGSLLFGINPSFAHQAMRNCPVRPQPATQ